MIQQVTVEGLPAEAVVVQDANVHGTTDFNFSTEAILRSSTGETSKVTSSPLTRSGKPCHAKVVIFIDESDSIRLMYSTGVSEQFREQSTGQIQAQAQGPADFPSNLQFRESQTFQTWPSFAVHVNSQALTYPYESLCRFACVCLDKDPSVLEKPLHGPDEDTSDTTWLHGGNIETLIKSFRNIGGASPDRSLYTLEDSTFLLKDHQEAFLLRYFIDVLSPWFDLCDNNRHFAIVAPRRALTNPTLLNSICAVSARHLSRVGDYNKYIADNYYQVCLETLIPALDDSAALKDETLFAATVILRLYEELNVPLSGIDPESHLFGAQVLLNSQKYTEMSSGLRQAAFWVALRQEINIALTSERPIQVNLKQCNVDLSFSPGTEGTWAYRSIIHCASVVQFCYSGEDQNPEKWRQLVEYHLEWVRYRPRSFEPLYRYHKASLKIPEIVYMGDVHVTAAQHHILARILLTAYNPRNSRLGLDMRFAQQSSIEIKNHVHEMIGTARGNPKIAPAMFASCVAILSCRTYFTDSGEQQQLLGILQKAETEHGWTTRNMQTILRDGWHFEDSA